MNKILFLAAELMIAVAAFVTGKYIFPKVPQDVTEKLNTLTGWAERFVTWARQFMKSSTGTEKMEAVVQKLKEIADEAGLKVTEDQLRAIAQTAYDELKQGWDEAQARKDAQESAATLEVAEGIASVAPIVNVYTTGTTVAVATDNVPDGALKQNEDGTYNTYDAAGNKTGTISPEEVEEAASGVDTVMIE
jgi:DNA polymerase III delta prime subunit